MNSLSSYSDKLAEVIELVSAFCHDRYQNLDSVSVELKAPADYVSAVDRESEAIAVQALQKRFPDIPVVGEEGGGEAADWYWIVDPIDGTANFLSGLPIWAVSIALVSGNEPLLGAVALPALGTTIIGGVDLPLRIEGPLGTIDVSGVAFGIGRNPGWPSPERQAREATVEELGHHVVCLGSCGASLAFVAVGRLAGYEECGVAFWDCAAGFALCRSAGKSIEISQSQIEGRLDVRAGSTTQAK